MDYSIEEQLQESKRLIGRLTKALNDTNATLYHAREMLGELKYHTEVWDSKYQSEELVDKFPGTEHGQLGTTAFTSNPLQLG